MSQQVTVVKVTIEDQAGGGISVYSETLPGLMLSGSNRSAICDAIVPAIKALLERLGYKVANIRPERPIRTVMGEPSPRDVDMHVQQFVVEYLEAA